MIALTLLEITQLRENLAAYPDALRALQEIEDCDGDLEDAAISLALKSEQEPDTNEQWLVGFAKRYRHIACQPEFRADLKIGQVSGLVTHLMGQTDCPVLLAAPVAICIFKSGLDDFCKSFDNARVQ